MYPRYQFLSIIGKIVLYFKNDILKILNSPWNVTSKEPFNLNGVVEVQVVLNICEVGLYHQTSKYYCLLSPFFYIV